VAVYAFCIGSTIILARKITLKVCMFIYNTEIMPWL